MKRKYFVFALVAMLLTPLLAACGGTTGSTTEPTATTAPAPEEAAPTTAPEGEATDPTATPAEAAAPADATPTPEPEATVIAGRIPLKLWTHSAGNPGEIAVLKQEIEGFNKEQDKYQVIYQSFPQASYNDSVAAASVAKSLPCILDLDAPTVPNFAWSNYVRELPVTEEMLADLSDSAIGTYKDKVYALGQFDVALVNYARKSILEKNNIRIPTLDEPWTADEFNAALETLKGSGDVEYAFDLNPQYTGEWWSYAYSPMLQSFGGDLIDRDTYLTAEGALNGEEAVNWGEWFQSVFKDGYANPKPTDDKGFAQGRVGIWYTGSWAAPDLVKNVGEDVLFLPAVDFGNGPKIGGGSWQWGVSTSCEEPEGAIDFVMYMMEPENIALFADTTGLIPTSEKAAEMTTDYAEGGKFRVFFDMLNKYTVMRPPTPGYLIISSNFEKAGNKVRDGNDIQNSLDDAVDAIDRDIEDHDGYGFK